MPSELRLHPLSILFTLGKEARKFALPGLFAAVAAGSAGLGWQVWMMLLLIPSALAAAGRYLSFRFRYEANEMVIRTGLLFRNERHVPYGRVQNLDAVQNVVHRLLGVVEVRVQTGGGQEPEATFSVLPLAALEEMRRRVFAGRGRAAAAPADREARTLLQLPARELMLFGLVRNRGAVLLAALVGLLWELGLIDRLAGGVLGEKEARRGVARKLSGALAGGGGLPLGRIALALAVLAGFLLLIRLLSVGLALVRLHGFRLSLAGEDLRTEYGLLTRVVATIPRRRIQTLTVREGLLHRLLRRVSVRVETAGGDGGEAARTQREWLAPILRREELPALVARVLPELNLGTVAWRPAPPRAFRRELKRWMVAAVALCLPLAPLLKGWALAVLAVLLAWAVVGARRTVAHLGWAATDAAVLFRSGWLLRQVKVAPFAKIQAVALHESPFDRRAAMARVRVDTAGAGAASHRVDIPYLPRETARDLHALLAAQAAGTTFRW
jgi:putative membrane protein